MEKYLTISLGKFITFKDSLQFLGASLEQFGKNLRASGMEKFKMLRAEFPGARTDQLDLLLRKHVYSYEFMDSWERFNETSLPPKDAFFNKLRDQPLTDTDYAHAQKVWSAFGCKTILDYHHIYLKCMTSSLDFNLTSLLPDTSPTSSFAITHSHHQSLLSTLTHHTLLPSISTTPSVLLYRVMCSS